MNIINTVKKFWKVITCVVVVGIVSGAFLAYVSASNEPVLRLEPPASGFTFHSGDTELLLADVDNLSLPEGTTVTKGQLLAGNVFWYTENSQVISFLKPDGSSYSQTDSISGSSIMIKALKAGTVKLYARYYYNKDDHTEIVNPNYLSNYAYVTLEYQPFKVCLDVTSDYDVFVDGKIYDGTGMTFRTNSYTNDPVVIETNNDVVTVEDAYMSDGSVSFDSKNIFVNGGGKSEIIVRTTSGRDLATSSMLVDGLYQKFTIYGKVHFGTRANNYTEYYDPARRGNFLKISEYDYGVTAVQSNIITDASAEVSYTSSDPSVAYMEQSVVTPVSAGITQIRAGVMSGGNFMSFTDDNGTVTSDDSIYVWVPLMWNYKDHYVRNFFVNMGIDDQYKLLLNNGARQVDLVSSDTTIATVSADGTITAVGKGTATITATVLSSGVDVNASYADSITMDVVVGDMFSFDNSYFEMQIGESRDIQVLTSSTEAVTYTVNGTAINEGSTGVDGLTVVVDEYNPLILHVTATKPGTYNLGAVQIIEGLVKNIYATVEVKTAVTGITITPKEVTIPINGNYVLNAVIAPGTAFNKEIIWVSSDLTKVKVEKLSDYEATITGLVGGTATVTALSATDGTIYDICTVHVTSSATGIELNEKTVNVNMVNMKQYQLIATVFPVNTTGLDDGIDRTVIWESSNEAVLQVDNKGLVTFISPGYATVVARTEVGGYTAMCDFMVSVPVESVTIQHENIKDLQVGQSVALTAEVLPLTATNRTVVWTTSDTKICTIDTNGKMTAVGPGDAVVWCRSIADGNVYDYITVHIIEPVDGISLNLTETTVRRGTEFWLYATINPPTAEYKDVEWTSSDPSIATVGTDGKVTALLPGTVIITAANLHSGTSAQCIVTITESVTSITLKTGTSEVMFVGARYTIVPEILPIDAQDKSVTYFCSDETIATVDAYGVVTALKGGECDIVVTTNDRQLTAYCHITVKEYVSTITLDKTFTYINIGNSTKLNVTLESDSASNRSVVWGSSDESIVTVDGEGNIYGNKIGTAVVTAAAADGGGAIATCVVQVVEPVTGIRFNDTTMNMYKGDTRKISVTVSPSSATVKALVWESSDPAIATVDEDGEVTAVAPGKCKITATSTDGNNVKAVCTVYVKDTANATSLTITPSVVNFKVGDTRNLTVRSVPTSITETVSWISSDPTVVMVDGNGMITGVGAGTATVTAYGRVSGAEAVCTVNVDISAVKATSIRLNTNQLITLVGKTNALQYRLMPTNSVERINWISSDPAVATVDMDGKVTTVGPGVCQIIAQTSIGGLETTCTVYSMGLSKTSMTMQQYDPFMLYVDGIPDNTAISWRTGNPRIATVSANGEVIGRKAGTTTITATIEDKTLTCIVKIIDATAD